MAKLERAVRRARKAKEYVAADDDESAIEQLKLLFNR